MNLLIFFLLLLRFVVAVFIQFTVFHAKHMHTYVHGSIETIFQYSLCVTLSSKFIRSFFDILRSPLFRTFVCVLSKIVSLFDSLEYIGIRYLPSPLLSSSTLHYYDFRIAIRELIHTNETKTKTKTKKRSFAYFFLFNFVIVIGWFWPFLCIAHRMWMGFVYQNQCEVCKFYGGIFISVNGSELITIILDFLATPN